MFSSRNNRMRDTGEPEVDTSRRRPRRIALGLLASGLLLAILGTLGVYFTTFPGVTIKRVSFSTAHYESTPREVSALLILPYQIVGKLETLAQWRKMELATFGAGNS